MGLLPAQLKKIAPKSKGIIQNSVTGIGATALLQTVDNLIGSPAQRFGLVIPFIGIRVSLIDLANYLIHSDGKFKISKNGLIAVGAAKAVSGAISFSGLTALGSNVSAGGAGTPGGSVATGGGL